MTGEEKLLFIRVVFNLARQLFPKYTSKYSRKDFTLPQLIALNCFRIRRAQTYRDFIGDIELMDRVRDEIGLQKTPHFTTIQKAFDRVGAQKLRGLLALSYQKLKNSSHMAMDATGFERGHASRHYTKRTKMTIQALKTTVLIDTKSLGIKDVHMTTTRKHDTQIGPQLALRNAEDLHSLSGDRGFDDQSFREKLRNRGVRPLIKHREYKPYQIAANERMDASLYNKRNLSETAFSMIKRKQSETVSARIWYRQFREMIVRCIAHNVEQFVKQLYFVLFLVCFSGSVEHTNV